MISAIKKEMADWDLIYVGDNRITKSVIIARNPVPMFYWGAAVDLGVGIS